MIQNSKLNQLNLTVFSLMNNYKWLIRNYSVDEIQNISCSLGVKDYVAKLLNIKQIKTKDTAKIFFNPSISNLIDPFLMKSMHEAVERLSFAINHNEKIMIYGDYDVDGITSVAMMYMFLNKFTDNIEFYIPDRNNEGYGISIESINYAKANNVNLIIALDCGIKSCEEVSYARAKNIDYIICDHHEQGKEIPDAIAVLDPKRKDCNYPFKHLSGCGVGFKLVHAYCISNNLSFDLVKDYFDLLAISVIADMVPLIDENRIFVFHGLREINNSRSKPISHIIKTLNIENKVLSEDVSYRIAPLLNSSGRLSSAEIGVKALLSDQKVNSYTIIKSLIDLNNQRKEIQKKALNEADLALNSSKNSIIVFSEKWHKGIVGIVASNLVDKYNKPSIVLTQEKNNLVGSVRTAKGINVLEILEKCSAFLTKYGGHKSAAGLSLNRENLNKFKDLFEEEVGKVSNELTKDKQITIDLVLSIDEINDVLYRTIMRFAPFGLGNEAPVFCTNEINNFKLSLVGNNNSHLKGIVIGKSKSFEFIGFNLGHKYDDLCKSNAIDICYTIYEDSWRGEKKLKLKLIDIK